jgi:hypothetical protein
MLEKTDQVDASAGALEPRMREITLKGERKDGSDAP